MLAINHYFKLLYGTPVQKLYTVSHKKSCYNVNTHKPILEIFSRTLNNKQSTAITICFIFLPHLTSDFELPGINHKHNCKITTRKFRESQPLPVRTHKCPDTWTGPKQCCCCSSYGHKNSPVLIKHATSPKHNHIFTWLILLWSHPHSCLSVGIIEWMSVFTVTKYYTTSFL